MNFLPWFYFVLAYGQKKTGSNGRRRNRAFASQWDDP